VRIHVEMTARDREMVVSIRDEGVGIPPADRKRIFKRFYRTGRARTKVKGTGLGLFIVRSVVARHGGKVFVESDGDGQGSTFIVQLPVVERHVASR
jgi:two-component system sensor histidine kinase VicK